MTKLLAVSIVLVIASFSVNAQLSLDKKFEAFNLEWPKTKLHLSINQNKYAPGDTIFFKAWFLSDDLRGVPNKQIINLHLVDATGDSRINIKFNVVNGHGNSQLVLPDSLDAGIYLLTAFSSWMENFDSNMFFEKEIIISNGKKIQPVENDFLFVGVEGSGLVSEVEQRIAVYTSKAKSKIYVIDDQEAKVDSVHTDEHGFGTLLLRSEQNRSYRCQVDGSELSKLLPVRNNGACALRVNSISNNELRCSILFNANASFSPLQLVVSAQSKIYYSAHFRKDIRNEVSISFPTKNLPYGIVTCSLLDSKGNLLSSRSFYNDQKNGLMIKGEINGDLSIRSKVVIDLHLSDEGGAVSGTFCAGVTNRYLLEDTVANDFSDELSLFSELNMPFKVGPTDRHWDEHLDALMILSGQTIDWESIFTEARPKPKYGFENVIEMVGTVLREDGITPVPDRSRIAIYTQENSWRYETFTVNNGRIGFTMPDFYGQDYFFFLCEDPQGNELEDVIVKWDKKEISKFSTRQWVESTDDDRYATFIKNRNLAAQSFLLYNQSELENYQTQLKSDSDMKLGLVPDVTVNVQDYVSFSTMQELIREVVPSLFYRKRGMEEVVRVSLVPPLTMPSNSPLYVIDGYVTKDTNYFLGLRPADLSKISIVTNPNSLGKLGLMGKDGVVIVTTLTGSTPQHNLGDDQPIAGLNRPISFPNLESGSINTRIPIFRPTIYWNPNLAFDDKGNAQIVFYTTDDVGSMDLRIEGITRDGRAFSLHKDFTVSIKVR